MNLTHFHSHYPTSIHRTDNNARRRTAFTVMAFGAALAALSATSPAMAQALDPVVRGATIARDTIVAITLLLMTVGVGIAGYKIMFAGASFRDVSNLLFGGALAGAAAGIAAVFIA